MLQRKIEALDREDFEASATALEEAAPPERSVDSPSTDNNTTSPSSPANVSVDLEFTRLFQEAGTQFDQAILDLSDIVFQ